MDHASNEHDSEIDDFHAEFVEARIFWRYFPHEKESSDDEDNRSKDVPITKPENAGNDGKNADHLPQDRTASAEKDGQYHVRSVVLLALVAIEFADHFIEFVFESGCPRNVVFELAPFFTIDLPAIVDQIWVVGAHVIGSSVSILLGYAGGECEGQGLILPV